MEKCERVLIGLYQMRTTTILSLGMAIDRGRVFFDVSFAYIQTKSRLLCSPLRKTSSLSQYITAT